MSAAMWIGPRRRRRAQGGQALVIMVMAIIPALAMVALIVDGGNAWAQQRITQAGTDASSEAGATVLGRRAIGQTVPTSPCSGWDNEVACKVAAMATANSITVSAAYYTDVCGTVLTTSNTAAMADYSNAARVGQVGDGFLSQAGTTPNCTLSQPRPPGEAAGPAAGVRALGEHGFQTYIAAVIGLTSLIARADATAVTGPLQGGCAASDGIYCVILPIAVWYQHNHCDNTGKFVDDGSPWQLDPIESIVPMCKGSGQNDGSGAGNVGWLTWTNNPNNGISAVCDSIANPSNPSITLPVWLAAGKTGDSGTCFPEVDVYDGQTVLLPIYDFACGNQYGLPSPPTGPVPYGCQDLTANGSQAWYHVTQLAAFKLYSTYTTEAQCGSGNGSTSCLTGWFQPFVTGGNVGPGSGGTSTVVGVQLIH